MCCSGAVQFNGSLAPPVTTRPFQGRHPERMPVEHSSIADKHTVKSFRKPKIRGSFAAARHEKVRHSERMYSELIVNPYNRSRTGRFDI